MINFLSIVLLVFGVLQIILFFKVWGMTNNVQRIKEELCAGENDFYKLMLLEEKEKAFHLVKEKLVKKLRNDMSRCGSKETFIHCTSYIKTYMEKASLTGYELPKHLQDAGTFWDYSKEIENI